MPKKLSKLQRAAILSILGALNSGDTDEAREMLEKAPEWYQDWPIWAAGEEHARMPSELSLYVLCLTERAAKGYCRELEREPGSGDYVSDYIPTTIRETLS